ncbi:MAG: hypothetical protein EDM05_59465 [Leptolyngbya sp. IPPAS B-1204]|nr:DUF2584 family protein [Elainella sp. C42_A2020_010]RNJ67991.1 MAG: DUF2584 family protein [Leptolyngbya sp. IPPAS B-1204]
MGMPCQVNSILKLARGQDFPEPLLLNASHQAIKSGYRILPLDVPLPLVDEAWLAYADVIIHQLVWRDNTTTLSFTIKRLYETPFSVKIEE